MTKLAYHANAGDLTLLELFARWDEYADLWPFVHQFGFYRHAINSDVPRDWVGQNTYPALTKVGAFTRLRQAGIAIRCEAGALKPWDHGCRGHATRDELATAYVRVPFRVVALDEPLASAMDGASRGLPSCGMTYQESVQYTVAFLQALPDTVRAELVEAYPQHNASTLAMFVQDVQRLSQRLSQFTVDVDPFSPHLRLTTDLKILEDVTHEAGLEFGTIVTAHRVTTAEAYLVAAKRWLEDIRHYLGHWPDWLVVQSWQETAENVKTLPTSIPDHLNLLRYVRDTVSPASRGSTMRGPFVSGNFLRSPDNRKKHSALISAHPAPRNLGAYAKRGDQDLLLVGGFNSGDNPFNQSHWKFDIRRQPDRPRLLNTIELAKCKGIKRVAAFVFLDDSPLGMDSRRVVVNQAARFLKPYVDVWLVALEANEYLTWNQHKELGQLLRDKLGPKAIILQHLTTDQWSHRNHPDDWREANWCTGVAIQCKEDVMTQMAEFRSRIHAVRPNVKIYYGEGSTDWSNAECNQMAQRLYEAGLVDGSFHGLISP